MDENDQHVVRYYKNLKNIYHFHQINNLCEELPNDSPPEQYQSPQLAPDGGGDHDYVGPPGLLSYYPYTSITTHHIHHGQGY